MLISQPVLDFDLPPIEGIDVPGLARDLNLLVRERLVAGDSNALAIAFIQVRYGDYGSPDHFCF
ncbi:MULTISPECIES: cytochrome c-type biogenesis protein CcmH [Falsihalocynthiibacter]|uniref:cytochrome c-type biogenesis protein CcmH n=1 Tax=Falsihalocynthiibacter TaxID=2854182 RepID=UPI0035108896